MKRSRVVAVVIAAASFFGLSCRPERPQHEDFAVGMSRDEIVARFGEPDRKQNFTKSDEAIWGPIEDFWPQVPVGATVEIWAFQSTMSLESPEGSLPQAGQTELYFVNDSDTVDGIGFHIEGAVYEGQ